MCQNAVYTHGTCWKFRPQILSVLGRYLRFKKIRRRIPSNLQESQQMLYFVQQKRGNNPYLRLNVALCIGLLINHKMVEKRLLKKW